MIGQYSQAATWGWAGSRQLRGPGARCCPQLLLMLWTHARLSQAASRAQCFNCFQAVGAAPCLNLQVLDLGFAACASCAYSHLLAQISRQHLCQALQLCLNLQVNHPLCLIPHHTNPARCCCVTRKAP